MDINRKLFEISDEDLKEIFALFTSPTKYDREQIYDQNSIHYFRKEDLAAEYSLTEEKREVALDAWRAVVAFLHKGGYSACKDGVTYNLSFIDGAFIE